MIDAVDPLRAFRGNVDLSRRLSDAGVSIADQVDLLIAAGQDERNTLAVVSLTAQPRVGDTLGLRGSATGRIRLIAVAPAAPGRWAVVGEPTEGRPDAEVGRRKAH